MSASPDETASTDSNAPDQLTGCEYLDVEPAAGKSPRWLPRRVPAPDCRPGKVCGQMVTILSSRTPCAIAGRGNADAAACHPDASAGHELAPIQVFLRQFLGPPVALTWKVFHTAGPAACVPLSCAIEHQNWTSSISRPGLAPIAEFDRAPWDLPRVALTLPGSRPALICRHGEAAEKAHIQISITAIVTRPPISADGTAPNAAATAPARNSPSAPDDPVNMELNRQHPTQACRMGAHLHQRLADDDADRIRGAVDH